MKEIGVYTRWRGDPSTAGPKPEAHERVKASHGTHGKNGDARTSGPWVRRPRFF